MNVLNDDLEAIFYPQYGMTEKREVTTNGKVRVSEEAGEQLLEHPSGDFEPTDTEGDSE
ncbi:hypothetical protein [Halovenus marina]|uniref:hypothetical protein n=1 Tax=Halovenus marina TaxID=3396621 RepID=UPI003F577E34